MDSVLWCAALSSFVQRNSSTLGPAVCSGAYEYPPPPHTHTPFTPHYNLTTLVPYIFIQLSLEYIWLSSLQLHYVSAVHILVIEEGRGIRLGNGWLNACHAIWNNLLDIRGTVETATSLHFSLLSYPMEKSLSCSFPSPQSVSVYIEWHLPSRWQMQLHHWWAPQDGLTSGTQKRKHFTGPRGNYCCREAIKVMSVRLLQYVNFNLYRNEIALQSVMYVPLFILLNVQYSKIIASYSNINYACVNSQYLPRIESSFFSCCLFPSASLLV